VVHLVWEFDPTGNDIATSIAKSGSVFLAHEQSADAQGRVLVEDGELMPWAREYSYDNAVLGLRPGLRRPRCITMAGVVIPRPGRLIPLVPGL